MPKLSNNTKSASENAGRWRPRDPESRARSKRSLERPRQNHRPLDLPDGGDGDVGDANGDGSATVVKHAVNPVKDSLPSRTLNARTNRALPQQMYDAMLALASPRQSPGRVPLTRNHRKRQASDMVVYQKDTDDDQAVDMTGSVNFVPLDSEHRIRVNLTIGSDGDSPGGPMYAVSLSLPSADQLEPVRVAAASAYPVRPPQPTGTECDCFCPCLEQDDDDDNHEADRTTDVVSTIRSTFVSTDNATTSDTVWSTESSTTEYPERIIADVVSCPPPVLLFCDTGKSSFVYALRT